MKKILPALVALLLFVLLLLPSAAAHRPSDSKKTQPEKPETSSAPAPKPARPRADADRPAAPTRPAAQTAEGQTFDAGPVTPDEFDGDVRDLPQVPSKPHVEVEMEMPRPNRKMPEGLTALAEQPNIALAAMPSPLRNFVGLSSADSVTGGPAGSGWPPDINGDVGLNHYIQAVNDSWAIYNKSGTRLAAFNENSLWAGVGSSPCNGNSRGDPVVVYDQFADRWFLTNFAFDTDSNDDPVSPFYQCVAVSKTSDPVTGGWWLYALRMDTGNTNAPPVGTLNDYPKFGNWNDGCLYMSANGYVSGSASGMIFASLNKSDMESGAAVRWGLGFISLTGRNPGFAAIPSNISGARAASALPPAGTPNYFVSQSRNAFAFEVRRFTPGAQCGGGGNLSAPVNVTQTSFFFPGDSNTSDIVPQPQTSNRLDSLGDRVMQKVQYRRVGSAESLWVTHTVRTASQSGPTSPHWAQINVSGGTVSTSPVQQQIYKPDSATYRWMGSIAADRLGNAALGYSASSSQLFPSVSYSGRLVTDPLNNLPQTETFLVSGAGSQTVTGRDGLPVGRWGDYTAMSVDPADDCTFWYTNEYYGSQPNGTNGNWQTRIGAFKFPTCSGGSACAYSISPTANPVGPGSTTGTVTVTAGAGCAWTASSNASWLGITSGSSGSGNGAVNYSVAANTTNVSRAGTLTVAGQTFTVTQAAGTCPSSAIGFGQTLNGTLSTSDCVSPNRSGSYADRYTFSGTTGQQVAVSLSAAFDTYLYLVGPGGTVVTSDDDGGGGTNSRIPSGAGFFTLPSTGTYTIEATSFNASTTGGYSVSLQSACSYTIAPTSQSFTAAGGTGSVSVSTAAGCAWSASSGSSFVGITAGSTGAGNGTVNYSVAVNPSASARAGTLTVAGRTFTVNQAAGAASSVQLGAAPFVVNESAKKVLVNVTRTGSTAAAASVNYATADGTADRRRDYTQTLGTLNFAPGETTKTVTVFVTDDAYQEATETFSFALSNASGATLGSPSSATVSVVSDDATNGPNPVDGATFDAAFFVGQHYVDFLNRGADPAGLSFWTGQTTNCGNPDLAVCRVNVSAAFFLSIEFQETGYLVYLFYKSAYGDTTSPGVAGTVPVIRLEEFLPDTQRIGRGVVIGVGDWQAQLEANKQAYALDFVQRPRFLAAFPPTQSPAQFVDKLRQNTGAALSQTEINSLVAQLTANNTNAGRAAVLRAVAEDGDLQRSEKNRAFVLMEYFGYLRRNPNDAPEPTLNYAGWSFWLTKLNQFGGDFVKAEMVKAFLSSDEYRHRFGN